MSSKVGSTTAFSSKISATDEYINLDATDVHMVPYVTGGLGRLMKLIQEDKVPELPDYGHYTDEKGHFSPHDSCLMVLRYKVKKILDSKGQSAVLVLAEDTFHDGSLVVIKVLHTKFYRLGVQESHILWKLAITDPLNHSHTLRILTTFTFDSHYCLVFEPLLPDPLTNIFQEYPTQKVMSNIRKVGLRLLATLGFLHQQNLIHTDLKPENILLKYENDLDSVHVVDFGNTIHYIHSEVSLYYKDFELQTPLYRAPEVMFGVPFGPEIDIWSLGCIFAELYLGKPLLFGESTKDILKQMYDLLGPFPAKLFRRGKYYKNLKQYTANGEQEHASSKLFEYLQYVDYLFADLLAGMLKYDPAERLTASQAAQHPFFASHFPVAFLLPSNNGSKSQLSVPLTKEAYSYTPTISASIKKGQPSSIDLLRLGTSEIQPVNELEETTILKPSPRYKMKGQNLSILEQQTQLFPTDFDTSVGSKSHHAGRSDGIATSDISVVKNIISEKKDKFSDNVKEKMSSLLKAIRHEQGLVENNLEQRFENERQMSSKCQGAGGSAYQLNESVRPVPKYGAYRENVPYRAGEGSRVNQQALMKTLKLQNNERSKENLAFRVPDQNSALNVRNKSAEKHQKFQRSLGRSEDQNEKYSSKTTPLSNKTITIKNEKFEDSPKPQIKTTSSHARNVATFDRSGDIDKAESPCLKSEEFSAPRSPGFTPTRTMDRSNLINQANKGKTQPYGSRSEEKKSSMAGNVVDIERLFAAAKSNNSSDRKVGSVEKRSGQKRLKTWSPAGGRSLHHEISDNDDDDDVINILSPMMQRGSSRKRQRYENCSPRSTEPTHTQQSMECNNMELETDRPHRVEDQEYVDMEMEQDIDTETRSQKSVKSPRGYSYSNKDIKKRSFSNESVSSHSSSQHSHAVSDVISEEAHWDRYTSRSSYPRRGQRSATNVETSMVKTKQRGLQGMPTPIEKHPHVLHDMTDDSLIDTPEIVYKTFSHHKVDRNRSKPAKNRQTLETLHRGKSGNTRHGNDKNVIRRRSDASQTQLREAFNAVSNRRHDLTHSSNEISAIKSSSRTSNTLQDTKHDKFSFLGTPASDRKLQGGLADRIAQRQKKLKKKARKSLNFQGQEEDMSDESVDSENNMDNYSDDDCVGASYGHEISDDLAATDYPLLNTSPHTITSYRSSNNLKTSWSASDHEVLGSLELPGASTEKSHKNRHQNLNDYHQDRHFSKSGEKLSRQGNVKVKDKAGMKKQTQSSKRGVNCDTTFVLDFESPLRPHQRK